jgi:hypothetical protein
MTALDAINCRVGRDSDFYAGSGIHRDRKAFAASVMLILTELRHIRSGSLANTRARPSLAERIRFVGNRLESSLTLRENGRRRNHIHLQLQEGHPHRAWPKVNALCPPFLAPALQRCCAVPELSGFWLQM